MYKPGRGGGGAGPVGRRPPPRPGLGSGRGSMSRGRGRGGPAGTSSSGQQQRGHDESFSLESGGEPDFASIIRLVPDLVEEIRRYESQGGTARIKFGSNPLNPTENVIEVGAKEYKFNWSTELGVCDIYEVVRNGENNNGLLHERGSSLRKMNVQRILDESAKNQVKMRSVQAELQSKSRKSIILDPANPSVQTQVKSMAAAGVEGSMRRWGGQKDKFKKNQGSIAAPPKKITIAKTTAPAVSPVRSPAQHSVERIEEIIPRKFNNFEKRQTPIRSNNGNNNNNNENSTELKNLLIKVLTDNPKGLSLKALEKAVVDSFHYSSNSSKKIESIVKSIASYQAPGRYILKPNFAPKSSRLDPFDTKSSPESEEEHDPILQALNEMDNDENTPEIETIYNNTQHTDLNLNLDSDPLDSDHIDIDIEGGSPNKIIDGNKNKEIDIEGTSPVPDKLEIDILGSSPVMEKLEIIKKDSSDSDSDSDSDSSDNSESSPSRAGSSSQSESENSSDNDDADVEVNITSDDDERETRKRIVTADLNLSPALKTVQNPSPVINLNEDLTKSSTPIQVRGNNIGVSEEENFDLVFGKKPVRENDRAGTSTSQKRVSSEKLPEASKRPKMNDIPFTIQRPSGSFQKSPASTSKKPPINNINNNNNNSKAVLNEGLSSDKPLKKHNRDLINNNNNNNNNNDSNQAKRLKGSMVNEEKLGMNIENNNNNNNNNNNLARPKILTRESSELELGEFREPNTPEDEFKRLFGSSSSSKPEEDDDDEDINLNIDNIIINVNNNNNNSNKGRVVVPNEVISGAYANKSNEKRVSSKDKSKIVNGGEIKGNNNNKGVIMQNGNGNNNSNGVKRNYSSMNNGGVDQYYLVYSKFDKDKPDLKGPVNDFSKYREYLREYQEKYKAYTALNKHLEEYREKYIKVGDEMDTAKKKNMRGYHKVVEKLKDMYTHDKEKHEFLKKVFVILHEELAVINND